MYTILVNDDNTLMTSVKERIMQRSKLVDDLCFLVNPFYKGYDMSQFTAVLEYLTPVGKKYRSEILTLSDNPYKTHLMYTLPFDTKLTAEAGKVEIQLTFSFVDLNETGKSIQRVRKTSKTYIEIFPITAWSDIVPDDALTPLDQRILKLDAQQRAMEETINSYYAYKADDIKYDKSANTLQLLSGDETIGQKVTLNGNGGTGGGNGITEEGVPVVDFSELFSDEITPEEPDIPSDNNDKDVVEF